MAEKVITRKSRVETPPMRIGVTVAVVPRIRNMLKMFDPTMFPTAISGSFLRAAATEVASSGSDVPAATMVSPMKPSLIPRVRAMLEAELTKKSPPTIRPASPPMMMMMSSHSG